jgi:hypothetical protein
MKEKFRQVGIRLCVYVWTDVPFAYDRGCLELKMNLSNVLLIPNYSCDCERSRMSKWAFIDCLRVMAVFAMGDLG